MSNENFLFFSTNYRKATFDKFNENQDFLQNHICDTEFVEFVGRPHWWYVNDLLGENKFTFNMKNDHFPNIKFKYHEDVSKLSVDDLFMNRAKEIADTDKEIDLFYSGGLDSAVIIVALMEICPKDQLNIILGTDFPLRSWPYMADRLKDWNYKIVEPLELFGQAKIDKNVFTTGCEADRLFGSTGFPHIGDLQEHSPHWNDSEAENYNRWWPITRHTYLTQSFRYLQDIKVSKFELDNYQPFFFSPEMLKFAINRVISKEVVWHSDFNSAPLDFLKAKMQLRDFVAKITGDKEYSYNIGKTKMFYKRPKGWKSYDYGVEAIYGDGTIIYSKDLNLVDLSYGINI